MAQENEIEAKTPSPTTDFLPSDGASCSALGIGDRCGITAKYLLDSMQERGLNWLDVMNVTSIMQHAAGNACGKNLSQLTADVAARLTVLSEANA